jgi:hypothetical protein
MTDNPHPPEHERSERRRRYALVAAIVGTALSGVGLLLITAAGQRDLGIMAVAYGVGVTIAATLLAVGVDPRRWRR